MSTVMMTVALSKLLDLDDLYAYNNHHLYGQLYNETMEWGTYKPNMFFGIKDRSANPLTVGLAWAAPTERGLDLRHTYRYQSGDGVTAYFEYHDGWGANRQIVEDPSGNARYEIDFIKQVIVDDDTTTIESSQWKALITIKPIDAQRKMLVLPFLYLTCENANLHLDRQMSEDKSGASILKVTRDRGGKTYESFEFKSITD